MGLLGHLESIRLIARLALLAAWVPLLTGCTVITVVDAAASAVVSTVETVVDWVIPD